MNQVENKNPVLLIDDDKFLADMYSMKFSSAGFTVEAFLSVDEALESLRGGFEPEAVVFDLIMPERDGFSLLQALRDEKLAPHAVKIALTNQSDDSDKKKAMELGADQYIVKASMIPSEVVETVLQTIKGSKK